MSSSGAAMEAGVRFVMDFFTRLSQTPPTAAACYAADAVLLDHKVSLEGRDCIRKHEAFAELPGVRKYIFSTVACQPCVQQSVLVNVAGVELMREKAVKFSRVFVILPTEGGAYEIKNDILEYREPLDEELEALGTNREEQHAKAKEAAAETKRSDPPAAAAALANGRPAPVPQTAASAYKSAKMAKANDAAAKPAAVVAATAPVTASQPKPVSDDAPAASSPVGGSGGALGTSWADKLKLKAAEKPAAAAAAPGSVQRVIGGTDKEGAPATTTTTAAEAEIAARKREHSAKKDAEPAKKQGAAASAGGDAAKRDRREPPNPAERFQYAALYVNQFPSEMTESDFEKVFSKFGTIKGKTLKPGSYCFIDFESKDAVKAACSEQINFHGKPLSVQERKSPEQRAEEKKRKETQQGKSKPADAKAAK
ncbi:hypothetical protein DIPPA_18300 [Diplonema papillatum]|nr:hypothetical protein DIPPA_18300 [Diplonema papillatum]|eukprot:gene5079-7804_t